MRHSFYSWGDKTKISWSIKTGDNIVKQDRIHNEIYYNHVTQEQSRFIALHVGIFWGIGTFILKNGDTVDVMLDSKPMYDILCEHKESEPFIEDRISSIRHLESQRNLKLNFHLTSDNDNLACNESN